MESVRRMFTVSYRQPNTIDWTRKLFKGEGLFVLLEWYEDAEWGNMWWKARW